MGCQWREWHHGIVARRGLVSGAPRLLLNAAGEAPSLAKLARSVDTEKRTRASLACKCPQTQDMAKLVIPPIVGVNAGKRVVMTPEWAMLGDQGLRKSATARQAMEAVAERMNKKRFIQTL